MPFGDAVFGQVKVGTVLFGLGHALFFPSLEGFVKAWRLHHLDIFFFLSVYCDKSTRRYDGRLGAGRYNRTLVLIGVVVPVNSLVELLEEFHFAKFFCFTPFGQRCQVIRKKTRPRYPLDNSVVGAAVVANPVHASEVVCQSGSLQ